MEKNSICQPTVSTPYLSTLIRTGCTVFRYGIKFAICISFTYYDVIYTPYYTVSEYFLFLDGTNSMYSTITKAFSLAC